MVQEKYLFMDEVDYWDIYDNSGYPRKQIASGGRNADTIIDEELLYLKIQRYVKFLTHPLTLLIMYFLRLLPNARLYLDQYV